MEQGYTELLLELGTLCLFGLAYYLWQRKRILRGPPDWRATKLIELHHQALNTDAPEKYRDIHDFIAKAEALIASDQAWMDDAFINQWRGKNLPPEVLYILSDCGDWAQSRPMTR